MRSAAAVHRSATPAASSHFCQAFAWANEIHRIVVQEHVAGQVGRLLERADRRAPAPGSPPRRSRRRTGDRRDNRIGSAAQMDLDARHVVLSRDFQREQRSRGLRRRPFLLEAEDAQFDARSRLANRPGAPSASVR